MFRRANSSESKQQSARARSGSRGECPRERARDQTVKKRHMNTATKLKDRRPRRSPLHCPLAVLRDVKMTRLPHPHPLHPVKSEVPQHKEISHRKVHIHQQKRPSPLLGRSSRLVHRKARLHSLIWRESFWSRMKPATYQPSKEPLFRLWMRHICWSAQDLLRL